MLFRILLSLQRLLDEPQNIAPYYKIEGLLKAAITRRD